MVSVCTGVLGEEGRVSTIYDYIPNTFILRRSNQSIIVTLLLMITIIIIIIIIIVIIIIFIIRGKVAQLNTSVNWTLFHQSHSFTSYY